MTDDAAQRTTRTIGDEDAGRRLDHVLADVVGCSRRGAWRLLEHGGVFLNDRPAAPNEKGRRLAAGDELTVEAPSTADEPAANPALPLYVSAEGPGWLVVCKPAGIAVHPLQAHEKDTLLNAVLARYRDMRGVGEGGLRSGVVHRLDLPTSGAVLLARDSTTWHRLRDELTGNRIKKVYHALVHGELTGSGEQTRDLVVARHRPAHVRALAGDEPRPSGARRCRLRWRAVQSFGSSTLVEVTLLTGFLHQIRVMLAAMQHPVVGDDRYGRQGPGDAAAGRLMLHAYRLSGGKVAATCPWPEDFRAALPGEADRSAGMEF